MTFTLACSIESSRQREATITKSLDQGAGAEAEIGSLVEEHGETYRGVRAKEREEEGERKKGRGERLGRHVRFRRFVLRLSSSVSRVWKGPKGRGTRAVGRRRGCGKETKEGVVGDFLHRQPRKVAGVGDVEGSPL